MTYLVLDTNYLCSRAFHVFDLSHDGINTGVTFGVFRDLVILSRQFDSTRFVFCFDHGKERVRQLYDADYKANRDWDALSFEERKARLDLRDQIRQLRRVILPQLGYANIFYKSGYEADDMIASVCQTLKREEVVIVSSDEDLFQLISRRASIWSPANRKLKDYAWFQNTYGIHPEMWPDVKALAGCKGDGVVGIRGIGDKTAAKYLAGTLNPKTKTYKLIESNKEMWEHNLPLVKLPYSGTPSFEYEEDVLSVREWKLLCESMGFSSLVNDPPISRREVRRGRKKKIHRRDGS